MGGFAFDISSKTLDLKLPDGKQRVTLTPDGILFLAQYKPDLLPSIQEEDIQDKSKADIFAKLLFYVQTFWFCLQVITRLSQHLPISLLEIATFAYVITAFFVYFMWWNKPSDILEPTPIPIPDKESAKKICAVMCMRSPEMCRPPTSRRGAYGVIEIVKPANKVKGKVSYLVYTNNCPDASTDLMNRLKFPQSLLLIPRVFSRV